MKQLLQGEGRAGLCEDICALQASEQFHVHNSSTPHLCSVLSVPVQFKGVDAEFVPTKLMTRLTYTLDEVGRSLSAQLLPSTRHSRLCGFSWRSLQLWAQQLKWEARALRCIQGNQQQGVTPQRADVRRVQGGWQWQRSAEGGGWP